MGWIPQKSPLKRGTTTTTVTTITTGQSGTVGNSPTHFHDASATVSGVFDDERLPERLRELAPEVTNCNDAIATGWWSATNTATNTPDASFWVGHSTWYSPDVTTGLFVAQDIKEIVSPFRTFRRVLNVVTWSAWEQTDPSAWPTPGGGGSGDVVGPASATNNGAVIYDGTTGKLVKDSGKVLPAGTIVGTTDSQTLTNKTLTSPAISSPTGLVKADVGLSNVDNTADSGKPVSTAQAAADAAVQAYAVARANHTGTQAAGTITGLATVATSGSAADLSGTLDDARTSTKLQALTSPTWANNKLLYLTGAGSAAVTDLTSPARSLLALSTSAQWRFALDIAPPGIPHEWSTSTDTYSDPGAGNVRFGDDDLLAIDYTDADSVDRSAYYGNYTSANGTITIQGTNGVVGIGYATYEAEPGSYIQFAMAGYTGLSFANGERVYITFALSP